MLRKSDLCFGALLNKQSSFGVKEKHAECSMKFPSINVGIQMAALFGVRSQYTIIFIHKNTLLSHQFDLLLVIPLHDVTTHPPTCTLTWLKARASVLYEWGTYERGE